MRAERVGFHALPRGLHLQMTSCSHSALWKDEELWDVPTFGEEVGCLTDMVFHMMTKTLVESWHRFEMQIEKELTKKG